MWDELIEKIDRKHSPVFEECAANPEDIGCGAETFSERARGFFKAANLVIEQISAEHNLYNAEMLPAALFLYRHSIELHLKSMRRILVERRPNEFRIGQGHNLIELWMPIENFLTSLGITLEDGLLHYRVGQTVREFSDVDEYGDRFRYPDSRSTRAQNWLGGNFHELQIAVAEVDLFSFGFRELVSFFAKT
jgi:hypothetical protein